MGYCYPYRRKIKPNKYILDKIRKENEFYDPREISETQKLKNDIQSMSGNEISIDVPSNLLTRK